MADADAFDAGERKSCAVGITRAHGDRCAGLGKGARRLQAEPRVAARDNDVLAAEVDTCEDVVGCGSCAEACADGVLSVVGLGRVGHHHDSSRRRTALSDARRAAAA